MPPPVPSQCPRFGQAPGMAVRTATVCAEPRWLEEVAPLLSGHAAEEGRALVYVNVGANKGYKLATAAQRFGTRLSTTLTGTRHS